MSKIIRKAQKIFGSSAGLNQISQFGSLAAGSIAYSTDPATIQALANYLTGWFGAVVGGNSPAIEDMNALCYLFAYQLAYLFQEGVAEWDSSTTYYIGSFVSSGSILYVSLTDNNTGNSVTDGTHWGQPIQNGLITPNTSNMGLTIASGNVLTAPYLTIATGQTYTIQTGAQMVGIQYVNLQGTAQLILQGNATLRII